MNPYLWLKWIHIVSSVVLVGTGFGSAFYLYFINRTNSVAAQSAVTRLVVQADWWFTTPAVIVQPATGFLMAHLTGFPLTHGWLAWALGLYAFAGLCWLPVVWLQIEMREMAAQAHRQQQALPARYWRFARYWEWLGYPAFSAMLIVFWLMVFKPQ